MNWKNGSKANGFNGVEACRGHEPEVESLARRGESVSTPLAARTFRPGWFMGSYRRLLPVLLTLFSAIMGLGAQPFSTNVRLQFREGKPGFAAVSAQMSGVTFTNYLAQHRHLTNQILLNGSGVAAGDVDGDGLADLYFCRLDGPNVLYRNLGNWRFGDITESSGVNCLGVFSRLRGSSFAS